MGKVGLLVTLVALVCLMGSVPVPVKATLPFEMNWNQIGLASFFATSVNTFTGSFQVPEAPINRLELFAMVMKLESITVTEGIAVIVAWNSNTSSYQTQLYYTPNGNDQVYSNSLYLHPGARVDFYQQWDYSHQQWTASINVSQTGDSLYLSFPEDLTLGLAAVELLASFPTNGSDCERLSRSNTFQVSNIGYNCGFVGCGPWITKNGDVCDSNVLASGNQVVFNFSSTYSS